MNCREISDLLPGRVAGSLDGRTEVAFSAHADGCSCCRDLVQSYMLVVLLARLSRPEPPSTEGPMPA